MSDNPLSSEDLQQMAFLIRKVDQILIDIRKRNDVLAGERDDLLFKIGALEHKLAECVTLGRRSQEELKQAKEKLEEYEQAKLNKEPNENPDH